MIVTIKDSQTGETATSEGFGGWYWSDGNGSCDCNRETLFGNNTTYGTCLGSNRYVIIKAIPEDMDKEDHIPYTLEELNSDYPPMLLKAG